MDHFGQPLVNNLRNSKKKKKKCTLHNWHLIGQVSLVWKIEIENPFNDKKYVKI